MLVSGSVTYQLWFGSISSEKQLVNDSLGKPCIIGSEFFGIPETNSSPLKIDHPSQKGNCIFQPLIFWGKLLVSGQVGDTTIVTS